MQLVRELLPDEWVVRVLPSDYGVDLEVEIVDQTIVTGNRFWLQLKGTAKPLAEGEIAEAHALRMDRPSPQRFVSFPIKTQLLSYSLVCGFPLLLFVADLENAEVYWAPLRDEIRTNLEPRNRDWQAQKWATVHIPIDNRLSAEADADWPGLRHYALEPAISVANGEIHAIRHELGYEADLSFFEYNEETIAPGEEELLREKLLHAEWGLKRALAIADRIPGNPVFAAARDTIESAAAAAGELPAKVRDRSIEPIAAAITIGEISHAIVLLSTATTMFVQSRGSWVTFTPESSAMSGTLGGGAS
jgi:Domain of unknown function (DUF4365)